MMSSQMSRQVCMTDSSGHPRSGRTWRGWGLAVGTAHGAVCQVYGAGCAQGVGLSLEAEGHLQGAATASA